MEEADNTKGNNPSESLHVTEVSLPKDEYEIKSLFETKKNIKPDLESGTQVSYADNSISYQPREDQSELSILEGNLTLMPPSSPSHVKPAETLEPFIDTSPLVLADSEKSMLEEEKPKEYDAVLLNPSIDLLGDIIVSPNKDNTNEDYFTLPPEVWVSDESLNPLVQPDFGGHVQDDVSNNLVSLNDHDEPQDKVSSNHPLDKVSGDHSLDKVSSDQPLDKVSNHLVTPGSIDQPLDKVSNHLMTPGSIDQPIAKVSNSSLTSDDISQQISEVPIQSVSLDDIDQPLTKASTLLLASDDDASRRLAKISTFTAKPSASFPSKHSDNGGINRVQIDTAMPIESVKHAVSKFGGIVDWKAHREQTVERRKCIDQELEKLQEEIPIFKQQYESSEEAKVQVLKELDSTRRLIEELKLNLERAKTEEQQARQDSELAKLRVEEMEQGIADEASIATKAQLEVAKARHASAVYELQTVRSELEQLREDYTVLVSERDVAVKKAEGAISESKEVEKLVEDLTVELITMKQSLEAAHAAHLEAEDHRIGADLDRERDTLYWEEEVKKAEVELERLNQQILSAKDLKSELDNSLSLLHDLKAELAAYMETKPQQQETDGKRTHCEIQAAVESTRREIEEVKVQVEKVATEVNLLKVTATSLNSELEKEKAELITAQQREEMASISATSIEAELNRTKSAISLALIKEKEAKEKMVERTKQLQVVSQDAERAKSIAEATHAMLCRAKEEAEQAKAGQNTIESQLLSVHKEIEAAKASEKLALAAMDVLEESESARKNNEGDSPTGVKISLEDYYELSKQAHAAEDESNTRVTAAISQIDVAKESELKSMKKLEDVNHELDEKRKVLEAALRKAEEAKDAKLSMEQELRKWREVHEERRKTSESINRNNNSPRISIEDRIGLETSSTLHHRSPKGGLNESGHEDSLVHESGVENEPSSEVTKSTKKKRRSFFPRIFMFLARKKTSKTT
ncbi:unnamed protein product [Cuscuta epithymum]|uniref:Protein WEAK CHLOROPLAST MOVEMENT UNDER BLUE LIGHT 1-like n=1 Tax=Cuscuta epithymum TaxID=186058 RepID=A0AAV0DX22_9ASTE|nr:unnamed protein product [Cuscuta epithymum]